MGEPLVKLWLFPSVSGTDTTFTNKKRRKYLNLVNLLNVFNGLIIRQKLIQTCHYLIYQPSEKCWKNISLYQELSWFVLDRE